MKRIKINSILLLILLFGRSDSDITGSDSNKIMMYYWDYNYEVNYRNFMVVLD